MTSSNCFQIHEKLDDFIFIGRKNYRYVSNINLELTLLLQIHNYYDKNYV